MALKIRQKDIDWLYAHRNDKSLTRKDKAEHLGLTECQVANLMYRRAICRDKINDKKHERLRLYFRERYARMKQQINEQ